MNTVDADIAFTNTDRERIDDWTFFGRLPVAGEVVETGEGNFEVVRVHHRPPGQSISRPVVVLEPAPETVT